MGFFSKLFSKKEKNFKEVKVDEEVIESVLFYSKKSFPNEFLSLLEGHIKDEILYITGLIFLPGDTSGSGAVLQTGLLPENLEYWGSVHSHPGPSAEPSSADLQTFSKNGFFHMIVCLPYSLDTFRAYDRYGNPINFTVGKFSDNSFDEVYDEILSDEDLVDNGEKINLGFLEDDDEDFFKEDDDKNFSYEDYERSKIPKIAFRIDENGNIINISSSKLKIINNKSLKNENEKKE